MASLSNAERGNLGTITITGDKERTRIHIVAAANARDYWQEIVAILQRSTRLADRYKRTMVGLTIDQALDEYYRLLDSGIKRSLKEIASEVGVSYAYLRKRKVAYDQKRREGKI
jgi:hypothetical protein